MSYKMKGSPFYRNFGIGSPLKRQYVDPKIQLLDMDVMESTADVAPQPLDKKLTGLATKLSKAGKTLGEAISGEDNDDKDGDDKNNK